MNEETQASGPPTGENALVDRVWIDETVKMRRSDWKRRQAIQPSLGRLIAPTLPERINRLNPSERAQVSSLIKSMKLRKIVRRVLAEAFWERESAELAASLRPQYEPRSMQRLRAAVRTQESMRSYERVLTGSSSETFEPVYVRSSHGEGNDSPAVKRVLESSLIQQR